MKFSISAAVVLQALLATSWQAGVADAAATIPRAPCNGPGQPACPFGVKRCGGVSLFGMCVGRRYEGPPPPVRRQCVSNFQGVCITKRQSNNPSKVEVMV